MNFYQFPLFADCIHTKEAQIMVKATKQQAPLSEEMAQYILQTKHDLRNPMNAVIGLSRMLASSNNLSHKEREIADTLKTSADDLHELIEHMFEEPPQEEVSGSEQAVNKPILLVEDYTPNLLVMADLLGKLNYEFDVAKTGEEALQKFSDNHYSFVLLDIQLPDMDGLVVTRRIRAFEKDERIASTPIIAISGLSEEREAFLRIGMDDCLTKPFGLKELSEKLALHKEKPWTIS
jgi:CheY-like chemotaxis protein